MRLLFFLFVIFSPKFIIANLEPIEQFIRGLVYTSKDVMQKVIYFLNYFFNLKNFKFLMQIKTPQIITNSNGISFQLDSSSDVINY